MTHLPVEAEQSETAERAVDIMRQETVRHVPVMNGSHFVGIVSEHDLLEARIRLGKQFDNTPLAQVVPSTPLMVTPVEPVDMVVRQMLEQATDSAAVIDGGFVVGVFTTTDALRFIADFCG